MALCGRNGKDVCFLRKAVCGVFQWGLRISTVRREGFFRLRRSGGAFCLGQKLRRRKGVLRDGKLSSGGRCFFYCCTGLFLPGDLIL